jgi:hypothetical protein
MDVHRFDALTRRLAAASSRRTLLTGLAVLGSTIEFVLGERASAKKGKKRKKVKRNTFGCVNVGRFCKQDSQCCSGICQGKLGKKKCKAHDTGSCQAGQDSCLGPSVSCGMGRNCFRTTGNASFCTAVAGTCFPCNRDPDCPEEEFGPRAACVVCASECLQNGGTACFPADV